MAGKKKTNFMNSYPNIGLRILRGEGEFTKKIAVFMLRVRKEDGGVADTIF